MIDIFLIYRILSVLFVDVIYERILPQNLLRRGTKFFFTYVQTILVKEKHTQPLILFVIDTSD